MQNFMSRLLYTKKTTVFDIMLDYLIALMPTAIAGCIYFGGHALVLIICCALSAVISEFAFSKLLKVKSDCRNLSAVVTGLIIALTVPASMPVIPAVICVAVAIVVTRVFFGGVGREIVNTAAFGAVLTRIAYPILSTSFTDAFTHLKTDSIPLNAQFGSFSFGQLVLGAHSGTIGEVGAVFIAVGALYLLIRRVISPVPAFFTILATVITSRIFGLSITVSLLGGGLLLCSVFMVSDKSTCVQNVSGQIVSAIICGILAAVIRRFTANYDGIYLALIFVNILRPLFMAIPDFKFKEVTEDEKSSSVTPQV